MLFRSIASISVQAANGWFDVSIADPSDARPGLFYFVESDVTPAFSAPLISIGSPAASAGFTLTVSNGILSSLATTTVDVHPPIGAPGVDAGPVQVVQTGAAVTLNGVAADPNVPDSACVLRWLSTMYCSLPSVAVNRGPTS